MVVGQQVVVVVGQQVVIVVGQQLVPIELDWQPLLRGSKKGQLR